MTATLLDQFRANLKALLDERATHQATIDEVLATAEARGDGQLDAAETAKFNEARDALKGSDAAEGVDARIDAVQARIAEIDDADKRKQERDALAKTITPEAKPATIKVRSEEPAYRKGGDHSFFADAYAVRESVGAGLPGGDAAERLERNRREFSSENPEARAVTTSGFGGMVVPQYLTDEFAEVLRAGRVTANLCRSVPLPPDGMTLTIPRGTTGTLVASQSDQNTALTSQDYAVTNLTINVNTIGGLQDLSRQSVERGTNIDMIIGQDLFAEYARELDAQVINGAGTAGKHTGILSTTTVNSVTTGTATAASILSKIAKAISDVNSNRYLPPDVIIMHPRRWGFLTAAVDSNGRPLVVPANGTQSFNAFGSGDAAAYGFVGSIQGLPVYTDANIPTTVSTSTITGATEDNIVVARRADLLLWEDDPAPRSFRFEEVLGNQLSVRFVVAGYSAFTAYRQPKGVAVISGSGMTTPTFA